MKFEFFIAKKYLLKGRKSSFISIISLVSIIGIAIGVAALIIALSLISGFQNDIRNKILNSTAHIMINNMMGEGLDNHQRLIEGIKDKYPEITSASPVVFGTVLLKGGGGKNSTGTVLRGIDLNSSASQFWKKKMDRGRLPDQPDELIIGQEIAIKLNLFEGGMCTVITPQTTLSPTGIIPRIRKMKVSGIFKSGLYEIDSQTIITNLKTGQKLFRLKDKISYIQIYLKDLFQAEELSEKMREDLPLNLSIITWKDLNASLYSALELEKTILFFTLTLIIIVASLNIIAGLILLVIQKIKDIGILLSYGATPKIIKRIFFIQGSIIGFIGTAAGLILGLLCCYFANKFELIKVPYEIYHMTHMPFKTNLFDILAVVSASLLISLTATLIPSKKAAKINVIDAVKNE